MNPTDELARRLFLLGAGALIGGAGLSGPAQAQVIISNWVTPSGGMRSAIG